MLLVKGFNKFVNATKENNSLEITKDFRFITSLTISLFLGFISVCRFKSQPYYRHLAATPSFEGQIAEAPAVCPPNNGVAVRWR